MKERTFSSHAIQHAILAIFIALVCCLAAARLDAAPTISYVQANYATPQSSQTTVGVPFLGAQTAGNLNVVVVGWNDSTATVNSVRDSKGNVYTRAVGPTTISGTLSQSIYYAKNILQAAANANTVTVTFSTTAIYPDIRILEYSGADTNNPVDVTAAKTGNGTNSNSGAATTTNATDLLFGANIVTSLTSGPGSGFTSRLNTSPDGDIAEDRFVTTTGSYSATAPLSPAGRWIMQMVALRAAAGFTISASPSSLTIASGNQGISTITTAASGGFNSSIALSASGAPTGTTVSFNPTTIPAPGSGTSTMTIMVGVSTPPGVYPITVTGNGAAVQQSTTVTLTVPAIGTFTISASPVSLTIAQGNQGTSTITTTISGSFNSSIALSASGVPTGTTVAFNPSTISAPGSGSSAMTIAVSLSTPTGTYPITVTGNGGGIQQNTAITLTVIAAANFSISASPASLTVTPGNQGTSSITTAVSGGFNSSITLSASGVPTGTTVSFIPTTIPAPGSGSSTMTITVGSSTPTGTYPITVTGTGGGIQHDTTVTLTVTAAADFTISASPASLTVTPGNQGTSAITTAVSGEFNSSIALSASGVPTGTTVSFNPATIPAPGSGTSTMTITVGSSTPTGTYPITVTGTGGGIQQSTIVSLTVTAATGMITFVQGNYATPQSPQSRVTVPYLSAQTGGDLNVVVVGWNDSIATVSSVQDSRGNTYTRAVGPTIISGTLSQSIYYCSNIGQAGSNSNTVTVTFSTAAIYPDIRILEYSGADPTNPVDVTAANTGNGTTSSSGSATTTSPFDLLFGANIVTSVTSGPGSGYTSRMITSPDADIAEDRFVTTTGGYSATAPLSSGAWIMQMVAFRANTSGGPVLTSIAVAPMNPVITVGAPLQFTATGAYSDGSHQDLTNSANWTSSNPSVATINNSGLATGVSPGSSTIQASVAAITGSTTLTVSAVFAVSPRAAVVTFTQAQQFTTTLGFGNVTWLVDGVIGGSPDTGTISTNGLYTPPAAVGDHTITANTDQQQSANASVYVSNYAGTFTYHNDNLRTGQNNNETVLTPANVNRNQFGKLFSYPLDGVAFAESLYVQNVNMPGSGTRNVVYVATEHDSVYAFDADGLTNLPLWHVSFLTSGATTIPCGDTGECGDISVEIGITGTPVIDQSTGTIYVVANTKESGNYFQRLHALDITTGAEKFGGPVVISGTVPGNGDGSSGGVLPFEPLRECQRPGLLLSNGVVYLGFGSHGDISPYHGWIIGYNATTLHQTMIYSVTPDGYGGGVWQGGGGLATDSTGNIYYTTSNGTFDANTGGKDYGDTVQKLSPSGSVVDYFTPFDQQNMDVNNLDLGAGGPVLLLDQQTGPYPHELITAGKTGTIYVVNRDNLGRFNPSNDNQIIQSLPGVLPHGGVGSGNFSTPVYFNGYVYFAARNDSVKAFRLTNGLLSAAPVSESAAIFPIRGGSFAISANGNANGILWVVQNNGQSPDNDTGAPGVLFAYDATNLGNELYNSSQAGTRDTLDFAAKFAIPTVANGKIFVAGQSQLTAFGLLP